MLPFTLEAADDASEALGFGTHDNVADAHIGAPAQYLAGGTQLLDLMKLGVMRPERLIDINRLARDHGAIETHPTGLKLGALVRMAEAAEHPVIRRDYPVLSDALWMAASPQLRNMASLAGNVLQRTRCNYFRDIKWAGCNKRNPGSGCAAREGENRRLAVLGISDHCIANYPGDFAIALVALDAEVEIIGRNAAVRTIPFERLHRLPGDTPHIETNLEPGELITSLSVPAGPWTRRSLYLKIRDRTSYDFALASAAVALDLAPDGGVNGARIGIGGPVAKPWRAHEAEALLTGRRLDPASAAEAADAAFAEAIVHAGTGFKPELGRRTLVRALLEAARMEI
jgi:xanthine dehydrogenase YagS FAD-binding subunit